MRFAFAIVGAVALVRVTGAVRNADKSGIAKVRVLIAVGGLQRVGGPCSIGPVLRASQLSLCT